MKGTGKVRSNSQPGIRDSGCGREKACRVVVTPDIVITILVSIQQITKKFTKNIYELGIVAQSLVPGLKKQRLVNFCEFEAYFGLLGKFQGS